MLRSDDAPPAAIYKLKISNPPSALKNLDPSPSTQKVTWQRQMFLLGYRYSTKHYYPGAEDDI